MITSFPRQLWLAREYLLGRSRLDKIRSRQRNLASLVFCGKGKPHKHDKNNVPLCLYEIDTLLKILSQTEFSLMTHEL